MRTTLAGSPRRDKAGARLAPAGSPSRPPTRLTRFVFADERARRAFPDWAQVADQQAFPLALGAPSPRSEQLIADLTALSGAEFTDRLHNQRVPRVGTQAWCHPVAGRLQFNRELLDLPAADAQQLVVLLPADDATSAALRTLRHDGGLALVR